MIAALGIAVGIVAIVLPLYVGVRVWITDRRLQ